MNRKFHGGDMKVILCQYCTWYEDGTCTRHRVDIETTPDGFCHLGELADGTRVKDVNEEGLEWTE